MRLLNVLSRILMVLFFTVAFTAARGQTQGPVPPAVPTGIPGVNPGTSPDNDPMTRRMSAEMVVKRNIQRQQEIIADTNKLLQLAQQLNSDVSKSSKDTLSISVVKEAEEIEKLAKSVKEKMRDGQP
jgi:hypothetical protein